MRVVRATLLIVAFLLLGSPVSTGVCESASWRFEVVSMSPEAEPVAATIYDESAVPRSPATERSHWLGYVLPLTWTVLAIAALFAFRRNPARGTSRISAVALLLLAYPPVLLVEWADLVVGAPETQPEPSREGPIRELVNDPAAKELLMKQYETATVEIRDRIQHEHTLYQLKFTLCGSILGLLTIGSLTQFLRRLGHDRGARARQRRMRPDFIMKLVGAAAAVSILVDIHTSWNSNVIVQLGRWIRAEVEPIYPGGVVGWEGWMFERVRSDPRWSFLMLSHFSLTLLLYGAWVLFGILKPGLASPHGRKLLCWFEIPLACILVAMLHYLAFHVWARSDALLTFTFGLLTACWMLVAFLWICCGHGREPKPSS